MKLRESINKKVEQFDYEIAHAKSDKVALYINRLKKRWLCMNDLFYLCCITGNQKIARWKEFYQPFCDEVSLMSWQIVKLGMHPPSEGMLKLDEVCSEEELVKQRMYLCYRTFYKTTIITKCNSLQLLLNFPDIHIVICHNKQDSASANLVAIKNYFLTTELNVLFHDYIPPGKDWGNMTEFSVAKRTDWGRDEHSIMAVGVDTKITGGHWQVAKKNDLETQDSVNTEEQLRKTQDWDARFNIGHFDDPQTPIQDYEGTRYHFADLYSVKKNDPNVKLIEKPIVENGVIVHPKRFTPDGVEALKSDIWVFNCQMMLNPEDPAKMTFRKEMIRYFDEIPLGCNFYMITDPASARKKRSDYTVILIIAYGWFKLKYEGEPKLRMAIVDGVRDKLNPKQRIDTAIAMASRWNIKESGWEEAGLNDDNYYLEEKRREEGLNFITTPIKAPRIKKEDKIRNILVPQYAKGEWLWPKKGVVVKHSSFDGKNYDLTEELEYEFIQFPLSKHDDLMDVQTFLQQLVLIQPAKIKTVPESKGMTFGEYKDLRTERMEEIMEDPWRKLRAGALV